MAAAPPLPVRKPTPDTGSGFDQLESSSPSFGWNDGATQTAGLSVLFVSSTKDRTSRLQGILANHGRDIALTTLVHSKADAIGDAARQHDVLLFDFAIGPVALEKTLAALRTQPLGASIAIFVPQQVELPASVSSLANACVIDTTSGSALAAALRDAAWTPWQPVETSAGGATRARTCSGRRSMRCRCRWSSSTKAARSSTSSRLHQARQRRRGRRTPARLVLRGR